MPRARIEHVFGDEQSATGRSDRGHGAGARQDRLAEPGLQRSPPGDTGSTEAARRLERLEALTLCELAEDPFLPSANAFIPRCAVRAAACHYLNHTQEAYYGIKDVLAYVYIAEAVLDNARRFRIESDS
jgi:hypothetical protein